jgi:hypothetical protein
MLPVNLLPPGHTNQHRENTLMRIAMPCALVALLLTAMPASAAPDKQSWGYIEAGDERFLVYGVPESDSITLSFICTPKKKSVEVVTTVMPANVKKGRDGKIRLTNGSASLEYAARIGGDLDVGMHFAGTTPIDAKMFDLLDKGTAVRIEALGKSDSVPLGGIKKPLAQMRQACR